MTNGADIFDGIVTRLATVLPSHKRLPNPYDLNENIGQLLEQGWGLGISPGGENTHRFSCTTRSLQVTFQIAITRKYIALENDAAAKALADKNLLSDFEAILDDSWKSNFGLDNVMNLVPGFSGIQTVFANKDQYRCALVTMTVEYSRFN